MMAESNLSSNLAKFIDCTVGKSGICQKLLQELTGKEVKANDESVSWKVSNRYYSADIVIERVLVADIIGNDPGRDCEAVVFIYTPHQSPDEFVKIQQAWELLSDSISPSVCLIVCACSSDMEPRDQVMKWCVEHGFELVEWNHENGTDAVEDNLDKQGVARVSDALQAHMWPDMTMKDQKDKPSMNGGTKLGDNPVGFDPSREMTVDQILSRGLDDRGDPSRDINDISGEESFEELFGRFAEMKTHAESLPHEERKEYAEKVVKAFWQAIGGDEDELKDSD